VLTGAICSRLDLGRRLQSGSGGRDHRHGPLVNRQHLDLPGRQLCGRRRSSSRLQSRQSRRRVTPPGATGSFNSGATVLLAASAERCRGPPRPLPPPGQRKATHSPTASHHRQARSATAVPHRDTPYSRHFSIRRCWASGSPVFGFTSNRGKLLLETSTRMRCPVLNTLDVGYSLIVTGVKPGPGLHQLFFLQRKSRNRAPDDSVPDVEINAHPGNRGLGG